jgi:rhomboid protease GluP
MALRHAARGTGHLLYDPCVLKRRTTGSVVCPSCGSLVGVRDDKCYTCGRANPGLWGFGPVLRQLGTDLGFTPIVIGACTIVYVLTLVASGSELQLTGGGMMSILSPSTRSLLLFGMSGAYPVYVYGWWWTVLSASWLHGGLIHILFNMIYVRQIGPATAEMIGPSRTVIVYVLSGVAGFFLSSTAGYFLGALPIPLLHGAAYTMGASASIFGLLGALVHYGRKSGSSLVHGQALQYAIFAGVFGLIFPGIDNYAHLGGFLGGYVISSALNPLARERGDHLLMAIGLLALSALSILFAVLHGLGIL